MEYGVTIHTAKKYLMIRETCTLVSLYDCVS